MELRLLRAALSRRRGTVALAVLAVAIGASVAAAMLHVSADVSRKLSRELRALGPNLLVLPAEGAEADPRHGSGGAWLDAADAGARLAAAGIDGVPLLYVVARLGTRPVQVVGADLAAARRLHPSWSIGAGTPVTLMGARLMKRLGLTPGVRVTL